jgi:hypothetical protein
MPDNMPNAEASQMIEKDMPDNMPNAEASQMIEIVVASNEWIIPIL